MIVMRLKNFHARLELIHELAEGVPGEGALSEEELGRSALERGDLQWRR